MLTLVFVLALALFSCTGASNFELRINASTGAFTIEVGHEVWLQSADITMIWDGKVRSTGDRSLALESPPSTTAGKDALGAYARYEFAWLLDDNHTAGVVFRTAFKTYDAASAIVFEQSFPYGVDAFSVDPPAPPARWSWGEPGSGFPSFDTSGRNSRLGGSNALAFIAYGEIGMVKPPTRFPGIGSARYKANTSGFEDGVPLTLFDETTGRAAVLSPLDSFFDLVCGLGAPSSSAPPPPLRCGVIGTARSVPRGFTASTILYVGDAPSATTGGRGRVSGALMAWGALLLRWGAKQRAAPDSTLQLSHLGYSSVGHYFYGVNINRTVAETLVDVAAGARAAGLPFAFPYYLVDSFWYGETDTAAPNGSVVPGFHGTWRWDDAIARRAHMAPEGLAALSRSLGDAVFVMHMGEWTGSDAAKFASGAPPYASRTDWGWAVESAASLPLGAGGAAFWDSLFANMSRVGLRVFKLDHSQQQAPDMRATSQVVGATAEWLRDMALAAERHGIAKQYGGHISSAFLQSTTLPSANVARVSHDYIPNVERPRNFTACVDAREATPVTQRLNVLMGRFSVFPWAVGIYPYKDAFFSGVQRWERTTCLATGNATVASTARSTKPEWWGLQEPFPKLHALVAALSAGPVAAGDGSGDLDVALLMRTCRDDGRLLKPDRPAFIIDSWWTQQAFGHGGVAGEVTQTYSALRVGGALALWRFVLVVAMEDSYSLAFNEIAQLTDLEHAVAVPDSEETLRNIVAAPHFGDVVWAERSSDAMPPTLRAGDLRTFDAEHPVALSKAGSGGWGAYTLLRTAPWLCDGARVALLGELEKFVSLSAQRVASLAVQCASGSQASSSSALTVSVLGHAGERVTLWFVAELGAAPFALTTTVLESGIGTLVATFARS